MTTQYICRATLAVHSLEEIRALHPNASLPENADCEVLGFAKVSPTAPPTYDPITHGLRAAAPAPEAGQFVQQWEVYPLPDEEVAANLQAQGGHE